MKALIGLLLAALLPAGCVPAGTGVPGGPPADTPSAPPTAMPTTSRMPTTTGTPTFTLTASPTHEAPEPFATPPPATLVLPDGSRQAGALGSFCYIDGCADEAYWRPADTLTRVDLRDKDGEMVILISTDLGTRFWQARYAARDDHMAATVWPLASDGDPDGDEVFEEARFAPPPSGEWLLYVGVWFDGGDAAYYWYVRVP